MNGGCREAWFSDRLTTRGRPTSRLDLPRFRGQFLVFALRLWSYLLDLTPQGSLTPQAAEAPAFGFGLNAGVHARS